MGVVCVEVSGCQQVLLVRLGRMENDGVSRQQTTAWGTVVLRECAVCVTVLCVSAVCVCKCAVCVQCVSCWSAAVEKVAVAVSRVWAAVWLGHAKRRSEASRVVSPVQLFDLFAAQVPCLKTGHPRTGQ